MHLHRFFKAHWKVLAVAAKVLFSLAALAVIWQRIAWPQLWDTLLRADPMLVAIALFLLPLNLMLEALKWHIAVRRFDPQFTFQHAVESMMLGIAAGAATPFRAGDYAAKMIYLRSLSKWRTMGLVFFAGQLLMLATTFFGLIALSVFFRLQSRTMLAAMSLIVLFIFFALLFMLFKRLPQFARFESSPQAWLRKLSRLHTLSNYTSRDWRGLLGTAAARYVVFTLQYTLLMLAASGAAALSFWQAATAASATLFVKSLVPLFIGDLGIRELTSVYFLSGFGAEAVVAVGASLLIFVINTLLPAAIGLVYFFKLRLPSAATRANENMQANENMRADENMRALAPQPPFRKR